MNCSTDPLGHCSLDPTILSVTSLLELDRVGAGGRVLLRLEVVHRQPKLAQHHVAQLLQLACTPHQE